MIKLKKYMHVYVTAMEGQISPSWIQRQTSGRQTDSVSACEARQQSMRTND